MIPGQPDTGCSLSDDIFPCIHLPARLLMNIRRCNSTTLRNRLNEACQYLNLGIRLQLISSTI